MSNDVKVRVRMAPSPTGNLHLGTAYTTIFNYLFAKHFGGVFILRLEDTDTERNKKEYEENILEGLKWLGLDWDEGPFYQTQRLKNYEEAVKKLLDHDKAYYCFCTLEELEAEKKIQQEKKVPQIYSGKCRALSAAQVEENIKAGKDKVVRFKMPEEHGEIFWEDMIHGKTGTDSKLIGDFIIQRSNGMPLYNFAVVVDDIDMKITHVLRGDDHLSNTPKQIVLFEALEAPLPLFAHWPAILNPNRIGKLSKRENATAITDYRKDGYLPEALNNYFVLLGWSMPDDLEIMSMEEIIGAFDIKKMRLSPAAFDQNKLDWLNGEYIRKMSDQELTKRLKGFLPVDLDQAKVAALVPLIKERIKKLNDFIPLTDFIFEKPEYDKTSFKKILGDKSEEEIIGLYTKIVEKMSALAKPWTAQEFEKVFKEMAGELAFKTGDFFQLIRLGISGQLVTPPLFESIQILGEDEVIERLKNVSQNYPSFVDEVEKDLDITTADQS